jgi:hypothetical protein
MLSIHIKNLLIHRAHMMPIPQKFVYSSLRAFLYQKRPLQQNGDIRKRDGAKTMCRWLHLVQGRVYSSLSPPSLPPLFLTPPFKCDNKGSWPAPHFRPPPHTLPEDYGQILATSPKVEDGLHLESVSMVAEFGQQQ